MKTAKVTSSGGDAPPKPKKMKRQDLHDVPFLIRVLPETTGRSNSGSMQATGAVYLRLRAGT